MRLTHQPSLLTKLTGGVVCVKFCCSGLLWLTKALLIGRMYSRDPDTSYNSNKYIQSQTYESKRKCLSMQVNRCRKLTAVLAAGAMNRAHANILKWWCFGQFKPLKRNMHTKRSAQLGYEALDCCSREPWMQLQKHEEKMYVFIYALLDSSVSYTSTIIGIPNTAGQIKWPFLLGAYPLLDILIIIHIRYWRKQIPKRTNDILSRYRINTLCITGWLLWSPELFDNFTHFLPHTRLTKGQTRGGAKSVLGIGNMWINTKRTTNTPRG